MAAILDQGRVCDGYDVRCLLSSGERMTFHFEAQPEDVQSAVDSLEAAHLAAVEQEQIELEVTGE